MVNKPLEICSLLNEVVGDKYIMNDPGELREYSRDFTSGKTVFPFAVVKPATVDEVSRIAAICNHNLVSITTRGGGTGVSGGALPSEQGIVLSTERLNKIIEINKIDRTVITETGVVTGTLQDEVLKQGLCFPQNISSRESCFIGGNIAVAGGSPKSLKYVPVKNQVINMEVE
jgi:glycolate oxidase